MPLLTLQQLRVIWDSTVGGDIAEGESQEKGPRDRGVRADAETTF